MQAKSVKIQLRLKLDMWPAKCRTLQTKPISRSAPEWDWLAGMVAAKTVKIMKFVFAAPLKVS